MARKPHPKNFRSVVQYEGGTPLREAFESADTAIGRIRTAYEHGRIGHSRAVGAYLTGEKPIVAQVVRHPDGKVLYDGPNNINIDFREWHS
jgi:hypothetical protein